MVKKILLVSLVTSFFSNFSYRFNYYLRRILYLCPPLLELAKHLFGYLSKNRDPAFWDSELAGSKAVYLGGPLYIEIRTDLIASFIKHSLPHARSVLDLGCGGGKLALAMSEQRIKHYTGVDISGYAIR